MDAEKAKELTDKYKKLKEAYAVLKKGLIDKQDACGRLEQQVKEKEASLRQQLEETDHLQFQNARLTKQMGTLTTQVEELQKQKQTGGWSMQGLPGLITGKAGELEGQLRVLQEELMLKIQENEDLHRQLFEARQDHQQEAERLCEAEETAARSAAEANAALEAERAEAARLREQLQQLRSRAETAERGLEEATALTAATRRELEREQEQASARELRLRGELARHVPFQEARVELWNAWSHGASQSLEECRLALGVGKLRAEVSEASAKCKGILTCWARTFGDPREDEPVRLTRLRAKMAKAACQTAEAFGDRLLESLARLPLHARGARDVEGWAKPFKDCAVFLLKSHRRWVTCQSLVLVLESAASSGGDPAAAQRNNFLVDCLWRLHHCTRTLAARLRLGGSLPALLCRGSSSAHFARARAVLANGAASWDLDGALSDAGAGGGGVLPPAAASGCAVAGAASCLPNAPASLLMRVLVVARVGPALQDLARAWEAVGRCLSRLAAGLGPSAPSAPAGAQGEDGAVLEILGQLHGLCASLSGAAALCSAPGASAGGDVAAAPEDHPAAAGAGAGASAVASRASASPSALPTPNAADADVIAGSSHAYLSRLTRRLDASAPAIAQEEARRTRQLARQLAGARRRLAVEVKQQASRLESLVVEKAALSEELCTLQDNHAVLRMNFDSVAGANGGGGGGAGAPAQGSGVGGAASGTAAAAYGAPEDEEAFRMTPQEMTALKQHGYFVDFLTLSPADAAMAAGPPNSEALAPWELAVRKVYERHMRGLQTQVQVADRKAVDLYLSVQEKMELLEEQFDQKQRLRDEVLEREGQLAVIKEDLATTRKNYDSQLAMLTEHICTLSGKLTEKDAGLANVHNHKVLCGHCGMWNPMGKLTAKDSGGVCQTCKEKVLSVG